MQPKEVYASSQLTNHFLIAMPNLDDGLFARSVVYVCEHTPKGTLGLIVNKPADINLTQLFEKMELPMGRDDLKSLPVFQGGPVQTERGFVLHPKQGLEDEAIYASTLVIPNGLILTTSRDVLEAISVGVGPKNILMSMGYSAWGEGQLESELAENAWLTTPARLDVMFDTPIEQRYDVALSLMGLELWMISPESGRA
jgi:putative transcriptional regulator